MTVAESAPGRTMRVGLLAPRTSLPAWQLGCVERLLAVPGVELASFGTMPEMATARPSRAQRLAAKYFLRADDAPADEFALRFPHVAALAGPVDGPTLRAYNLDVLLWLGEDDVPADWRTAARHGVWAFRFGGTPPGFWEMYRGDAVATVALCRMAGPEAGPAVLWWGACKTVSYSYSKTLAELHRMGVCAPARACTELLAGREPAPAEPAPRLAPPSGGTPGLAQLLRFGFQVGFAFARNWWEVLFVEAQWNIGLVRRPVQAFRNGGRPVVEWLPAPRRGHFIADPFAVARDGRIYLLYEEYAFRTAKGRIEGLELAAGATPAGPPRLVFASRGHLSYPYLFEDAGRLYCVPESSAEGGATLYRSVQLPDKWEKVATLLPGVPVVDSSLFRHEGRWWLLATLADDPNGDLYAWYTNDLLGTWQAHALNPIKSDVRSSRPAGPPFLADGVLYRPAQDCSHTYGGRVRIQRVSRLTPTQFREETAATVDPPRGAYPDGLHTLCGVGDVTVVDGKRFVRDRDAIRVAFARLVGKAVGAVRRKVSRRSRPAATTRV